MAKLRSEWKKASKESHKRAFEVNPGVWDEDKIFIPRLSLKNQAKFEQLVAKDHPGFNLSLTRNRAAAALAEAAEPAIRGIRDMGAPETFGSKEEAEWWRQQLLMKIAQAWAPYTEKIFGIFTREHMLYALRLALIQEYGNHFETEEGEKVEINDDLIDALFSSTNTLEMAFVHAIGLVDLPEDTSEEATARSLDELTQQVVGAPLVSSGKEPAGKLTTQSSRSSSQSTGSLPTTSGN